MRQWRHVPPAPNFWAKKSGPHSDSIQIFEVINLYNHTVWSSTKVALHVGPIGVRLRLIEAYAVVCRIAEKQ